MEPTYEQLKEQIRDALEKYCPLSSSGQAAMLSGMSLAANFLAKLDGSKTLTAATVLRAASEIAEELNLKLERLK